MNSIVNAISPIFVFLGIGISTFFAIAALLSMAITTHGMRRRYGNAEWVPTPALVEKSDVVRGSVGKGSPIFTPVICFSYTHEGSRYESNVISPDLHHASSNEISDATRWTNLFPLGTKTTAFVDKLNPSVAVLFPDFRYGWWYVFLVMFAVFGGINFLWVVLGILSVTFA